MQKADITKRNNAHAPSFVRLLFSKYGKLPWLVLIIGVLLSAFISVSIENRKAVDADARFALLTDNLVKQVNERLLHHESLLLAGAGLFDVHHDLSRYQWQTFVSRLAIEQNYPGIQGIGFTKAIQPDELAAHTAQVRAEGFADYQVHPEGERDFFTSIIFLEPFTGRNLAAFGYDMFSEATRRNAMQRAVNENKTRISGKVTLLQETHGETQAGFLMYVPVYHSELPLDTEAQRWLALKGFVYIPYRMGDLMEGILSKMELGIEFSVYDGTQQSTDALLYTSSPDRSHSPSHEDVRYVDAYGHIWTLRAFSQPGFMTEFSSPVVWLVPGFSLTITLLLAILLLQLKRRNIQAARLAEVMSADLIRSERFLNMILEAASTISIIATDPNGTITVFNKGAEKMLGYSRDELVGKHSPALIHSEDEVATRAKELSTELQKPVEGFQVFVEKPLQDGVERREWTYLRKNGEPLKVSLTVTPIHDEQHNLIGFLGVADDISERKRLEKMKDQFISTVSHELRTPLASISGALDLIMTNRFGTLNDKGSSLLSNAHRNSKRLNHLINDLLDIEKIAGGNLHFEMQVESINQLLSESVEAIEHYARERQVQVFFKKTSHDISISVDKQRFMQVMVNLLSNAIKFSPEKSSVEVNWHLEAQKAVVEVIDQGPGISHQFQKRIFQRFFQADGTDQRAKGGTGLGLAISRELIERMGGRIDFESTEGEGSRFYFELPVARTHDTDSDKEPHERLVEKPRLLVLEDEPDVADLLAMMLEAAGYRVDIALTGADALKKLEDTTYALVTVDLMLPDTSGLDVIQQIKRSPKTSDIPIVVISAIAEQGRLKLQGDSSHIDWLAKPIQQERLLSTLSQRLGELKGPLQVLHIEDDHDLHQVILAMTDEQFRVALAQSVQEARSKLMSGKFDAVILDIGLPDGSGWDLLPDIKQYQPQAYTLVLSGQEVNNRELKQIDLAIRKSNLDPDLLVTAINERLKRHRPSS